MSAREGGGEEQRGTDRTEGGHLAPRVDVSAPHGLAGALNAGSWRPRAGRGTNRYPSATAAPMGTQIQNAHRHPPSWTATPPPSRPMKAPAIAPAWYTPIASERRRTGK